MKRILILIYFLSFTPALGQEYADLPLEDILTKKERSSIGINKLNESEKESLRILLIEKIVAGYERGK